MAICTLGGVIALWRDIHARFYEGRGSCFVRCYDNLFDIADTNSPVAGWSAE